MSCCALLLCIANRRSCRRVSRQRGRWRSYWSLGSLEVEKRDNSRAKLHVERARRNCPNSELPSSNLDQFFVSPLGGAKKRLGASDLTRGLHGHSCLRVRVGTLELAKWDKSPTKLQICKCAT